jgi:hypothetical protein
MSEGWGLFFGALFVVLALFLSGVVVGDGQHFASAWEVARWFLSFWLP